jgi:hypothetical protein
VSIKIHILNGVVKQLYKFNKIDLIVMYLVSLNLFDLMSKIIPINDWTCILYEKSLIVQSTEFAPVCQSYPSNIVNVTKNDHSEFQINVVLENGTTVVFDIPQCPICLNGYTEDNGKCQLSCSHSLCDNCIEQITGNDCPICKRECINTHMHMGVNSQSIKTREKRCKRCSPNSLNSISSISSINSISSSPYESYLTFRINRYFCTSLAIYMNDEIMVVAGCNDNNVRVSGLIGWGTIYNLKGHTKSICSVAITPDSKFIISGSEDKTVRVWNLETGECIRTLEGHTESVYSVAITPDSKFIVSGSEDKTVRVWNLETGECMKILQGHTDRVFQSQLLQIPNLL